MIYREALVFYWDNPAQTGVADLRADVALTVDAQTQVDITGTAFREEIVPGGLYAVWHALVRDGAYAKAWSDLYLEIENSDYELARGVCFENYFCDAHDGNWDLEIWQSVEPKISNR